MYSQLFITMNNFNSMSLTLTHHQVLLAVLDLLVYSLLTSDLASRLFMTLLIRYRDLVAFAFRTIKMMKDVT